MSPRPIFIVGPPRSGTTLTARILDGHPQVLAPGETHYFEEIWGGEASGLALPDEDLRRMAESLYYSVGRHGRPEGQQWIERQFPLQSLMEEAAVLGGTGADLYRAYVNLSGQRAGTTFVCDDTPRHLFRLNLALDLLPEALALIVMRDPRAFLASYKHYWRVASPRARDRIKGMYHPVLTSGYWRSAAQQALALEARWPGDRVMMVRYEELVQNPKQEIERICGYLSLPFDAGMLEVARHNSSFQQRQGGIFPDSLDRWRQILSAEEIWFSQRIGTGVMARLGYREEPVRPNWARLILPALTVPFALLRVLWSSRGRTTSVARLAWERFRGLLRR